MKEINMKDWLIIGRVVKVHGIRGEIKVAPITDDVKRFDALDQVWLMHPCNEEKTAYVVESVRVHKGNVLIKLAGVDDRNASETLKQFRVMIPREQGEPLGDHEIYIADLIGMNVVDCARGEIGVVADVLTTTGTVDTLDIRLAGSCKHLYVPFRRIFFPDWDLTAGVLSADIPQDYFEL
ncbi:ribosome maturation factor RimM [Pseudoramibacter faecis]|uniref:ribosome maturation factor RimM n=1 Tax=Pseudoramibacter faecis TaxID=3108534 RepID=UPI002E76AEB6|nr:ribosome maturation factor RimM [Pseudoramibacter sp. HA2172]